ncbi:MAG: hypothetical protein HON90_11855 [Halobacteriovoraceae bacterium]|jgi:hypothetical protein|nr:hypothetical protein [Halobacteriovoraceae bacterium]
MNREEPKKQFKFQENTYRDLLESRILNQHNNGRYEIKVDSKDRATIIDNG